ncbi:hypothetical protein DBV15_09980 [Temnothorax longispinosus]|uniref:Uncharacterized protein n=1 Tax=Temnothorax longispinosus TaxID=300112 RepID=A0A4S2KSF7_9HYME|nr:hypothetical protein DBV15_09980 [Temnothorax longispinosus]
MQSCRHDGRPKAKSTEREKKRIVTGSPFRKDFSKPPEMFPEREDSRGRDGRDTVCEFRRITKCGCMHRCIYILLFLQKRALPSSSKCVPRTDEQTNLKSDRSDLKSIGSVRRERSDEKRSIERSRGIAWALDQFYRHRARYHRIRATQLASSIAASCGQSRRTFQPEPECCEEKRKRRRRRTGRRTTEDGVGKRRTRHNRHFSCGTAYASLSWSSSSTTPRPRRRSPPFHAGEQTVNFDLATAMTRPFPRSLETRSPVSGTAEGAPSFPFVRASLPQSALTRGLGALNYYLQPDREALGPDLVECLMSAGHASFPRARPRPRDDAALGQRWKSEYRDHTHILSLRSIVVFSYTGMTSFARRPTQSHRCRLSFEKYPVNRDHRMKGKRKPFGHCATVHTARFLF